MHEHLKVVRLARLISSYELQSQAEFGTELDGINNLCQYKKHKSVYRTVCMASIVTHGLSLFFFILQCLQRFNAILLHLCKNTNMHITS